ncbi:sodium:proton antiporter [Sulfurovum sp. XGS-02]|uniref:Na+/H+ antiporter NhaC family protein n=1 Tax=Sulfurovum sp. XGS-02 TaxID=2925411 RepID=UPI0020615F2A|nr:Na+/H+ antiporter NhaC family protein [Sulfurovum sp. XGS-02]UPT76525.1 sodium:proton antiporter [Sulfurovum sp. XGS-02]
MEYGILSIAIPLLTIILAIITKDVIVSLMGGIFAGFLVLNAYNPIDAFIALFDGVIALFSETWITKTLLFIVMVGSIIRLLTLSGAVDSFVAYLSQRSKKIDSPTGAMLLAYVIGVVIFIESSITALVAGTVAKPLCDKNSVSREKLAYICDSTSAPICSLIPLNAWGALLLGLIVTAIDSQVISGDGVSLLISSIPYNFYSLFTLAIVLVVIFLNINIGPIKNATPVPYVVQHDETKIKATPYRMLLPILVMVLMVPVGLYLTGEGDIFKGSGSTSVYYAVIITLLFIYLYYVPTKTLTHQNYFIGLYEGIGDMIPVGLIMVFALLIGNVIGDLGTAKYLAHLLTGNISPVLIPLLIFLVASITAFSTGTSWGTFSIMMPIALALGATMDLHIPLVIAAVISGGIFGDHSSPISDTTIISSMAAGCDHVEHVRTQLPYALLGGMLASGAFFITGWFTV